jgi:hypothetical protein
MQEHIKIAKANQNDSEKNGEREARVNASTSIHKQCVLVTN